MAKAARSEKRTPNHPLAKEYAAFKRHLPQLLLQEGKFVLVHGSDVIGVFDSYSDALTAGYEKFGLENFLVKRISSVETPIIVR